MGIDRKKIAKQKTDIATLQKLYGDLNNFEKKVARSYLSHILKSNESKQTRLEKLLNTTGKISRNGEVGDSKKILAFLDGVKKLPFIQQRSFMKDLLESSRNRRKIESHFKKDIKPQMHRIPRRSQRRSAMSPSQLSDRSL